jgi:enoyl-CoA hydratase/carnithine racemase
VSEPLALRAALERLRAPDAHESFSAVSGEPLLAVTLSGDEPDDARAAAALAGLPAPSVALLAEPESPAARTWAARFDAIAADPADLARIEAAVRAAPIAAATLAQLLRGAEDRGVDEGLVAESLAYAALQGGPEHRAWLAARAPRRTPGSGPPLCVRRDGARLCLTLARPERRNAYSTALRDALVEALALALADGSIERIVLEAAGPAFCAGGDLDEFGTAPDPATAHAVRTTRSAARLLARLSDRVEARVHGACVGAGIELAAFAGRVVASEDAWFQLPELAMGLVPGAGGTVGLPRRIGRQRTAWLALTGARIGAAEAVEWGLVDLLRVAR